MANNPFDRVILNARERPLSSDLNRAQSQLDAALRVFAKFYAGKRTDSFDANGVSADRLASRQWGFFGDALKVRPNPNPIPSTPSFLIQEGLGFMPGPVVGGIGGVSGLDDFTGFAPIWLPEAITGSIPTPLPPSGQARIDIIEVSPTTFPLASGALADASSRDVFDPVSGMFQPNNVNKTLTYTLPGTYPVVPPQGLMPGLVYKVGTNAIIGTQIAPATDTGYVKLAEIDVQSSLSTTTVTQIRDKRWLLLPYGIGHVNCGFKRPNGAGTRAMITDVTAPPGVEVIVATSGNNDSRATVFIIAGGMFDGLIVTGSLSPQVSIVPQALSATSIDVAKAITASNRALTLSDQTFITANGPTGIVVPAIGQGVFVADLQANNISGSPAAVTESTGDLFYNFVLDFWTANTVGV